MAKIPDDVYKSMYPNGDASKGSTARKSVPFGFDDEIPTGGDASFYANDPLNEAPAPATDTPAQSAEPTRAAVPSAGGMTQQPPQDETTQQGDTDALPVIFSAADFCADRKDVQWLIKGHVQKDGLMMVYGESGAYKSFLVLDQALTIAAGLPDWNGAKVTPATVLYLTGEGKTGLQKRIAAWAQEHGAPLSELRFYAGPFTIAMNGDEKTLIDAVKAANVKPDWIIFDTLIHYLNGDENKAQDARDLIIGCNAVKNVFGCAVTLIHHVGVSEDAKHRARGSSAFRGAMDIEVEISAEPLADNKKRVKMKQTKNKDYEPAGDMTFTPKRVEINGWADEDGDVITSLVLEPETEQQSERALSIPQKFQALVASYRKACSETGLGTIDLAGNFKGLEHSKWQAFYCDSENGFTKQTTEKTAKQEFNAGVTALLQGGNIEITNPNTKMKETPRAKRLYVLTGKYEKEHFSEYAAAARNKPPQEEKNGGDAPALKLS